MGLEMIRKLFNIRNIYVSKVYNRFYKMNRMNIQYENEDQQTLAGSFKQSEPYLSDRDIQQLQDIARNNEEPKQIIHKIVYGDTLQGLSLSYGVSIQKIKHRNKIQSDTIYYLKQLVIPHPQCTPQLTKQQEEYLKVQQFMQYMSQLQKQPKAARYYLSQNNWNVQKAVAEYRQDLQWERKNKIKLTSMPLTTYNPLSMFIKKRN